MQASDDAGCHIIEPDKRIALNGIAKVTLDYQPAATAAAKLERGTGGLPRQGLCADARIARMPAPSTSTGATPSVPVLPLIRPAELRDVQAIVGLIRELAEFEKLTHLLQVTPEKLRPHLFGEKPVAEAMVAELGGEVVAFALYFTNFSTFLAQPGLYLEDLYVQPVHRGKGIGEALLTRLGKLAAERNYGRFEWSVLDWNENAIRFYERMGATVMSDWRICRIAGDALTAFAAR